MRITDIRTLTLAYEGPQVMDATHTLGRRTALLVEVHTDEGLIGIGEAESSGKPEITKAIIDTEFRPMLLGANPLDIERLWALMYRRSLSHGRKGYVLYAISGIDIALWDLLGKVAGLPVYRLLGAYTDAVPAYASGGFYAVGKGKQQLAEEMAGYVEQGFRAVKMKIGRSTNDLFAHSDVCRTSEHEDLERVAAVREAVGPDIKIMVDANTVWDPPTAIRMGREMEKLGIYFLEEPVPTEDLDGSAKVVAALDTMVAGYETECTRFGFRDLISHKAVDIVQPDVIRAGGLTECRRIAALASAYHMRCTPHAFASALSLVANLHLLGSIPNGDMLEYCQVPNALITDLLAEPIEVDSQGYVHLPEKPGLGVELSAQTIEKYRIA
ncbi:MAG: mandelate racemase/muconate lactonizing enzyme family protein [Chloroflexota bacterium]